ncbi:MAG: hypothetical protein OEW58_06885, partial [Gammaproteobacteria bacterium]|nr:hypothetical protein [Gammaproteobacteria bacterium]
MGKKRNLFMVGALSAAMFLGGCSSSNNDEKANTGTVSLSGVVKQKADGAAFAKPAMKGSVDGEALPSFAVTPSAFNSAPAIPSSVSKAIAFGINGFAETNVNSEGAFTFTGLQQGQYAVTFYSVDRTTGKTTLVASLSMAASPTTDGNLSIGADTDLGLILIDSTGRAISEADVNGTLTTTQDTIVDANGDGVISSAEAAAAEETLATAATTQTVSIMSFMGEANTWAIAQETMKGGEEPYGWDNGNGDYEQYTRSDRRALNVRRMVSVAGPQGTNVDVVKDASIEYYGKVKKEVFTGGIGGPLDNAQSGTAVGYYDYSAVLNC